MAYIGAVLATVLTLAGFFLLFLSLPGTWLILGTAVVWGNFSSSSAFTWKVYTLLIVFAVAGELFEFFAGHFGSKKFGGSSKGSLGGIIGAIAGAILGAPVLFGLGALPGALIGAFCGSFIFEKYHGMQTGPSLKAAFGATLGRFGGFVAKLSIALAMAIITLPRIWSF